MSDAILACTSIVEPESKQSSVKSFGPFPNSVKAASLTSRLFPIALPKGSLISVISALVSLPKKLPISTIVLARIRASSRFFMNAPLPYLTSSKIVSLPDAIFLDIIEAAINGIESTVPVTSLKAYNFLSAGTKSPVWPIIAIPIFLTCSKNSSLLKDILKPGIDSNLSKVPPVCPKPLPLILANLAPQLATIGPKTRLVLSPTPPVECLSTLTPGIDDKSHVSPELIIASVRLKISSFSMPL